MKTQIAHINQKNLALFYGLSVCLLVSVFSYLYKDKIFYLGIPFLFAGILMTLVNFKFLYYVLVFSIPFSFEIHLGNSFFAEVPTEPLMILFFFIVIYRPFVNGKIDFDFNFNILSLLVIAQFVWIIPVMFFSTDFVLSFKYFLAKSWYISTFMFGTGLIIISFKDIKWLFWLIFSCLITLCIITVIRYIPYNFDFYYMNHPVRPYFKNHVAYSTFIATFLPFVWNARNWYKKNSAIRIFLNLSILFLLFCIVISYTRATWISIPFAIGIAVIYKWKLLKPFLYSILILLILIVSYLLYQNKYQDYSPDFEKTVYHKGNIEKHLTATYNATDVSGMERIYRWIAAKNMILDKPFMGFGTNCFYDNYKKYAVESFVTYVSDNPEKSTTHNYFLMVAAEQGIPGLVLFLSTCVAALLLSYKYYHITTDKKKKGLLIAIATSLSIIYLHLFLNDLIETDKIGSLFYINLALLVKVIVWKKGSLKSKLAR